MRPTNKVKIVNRQVALSLTAGLPAETETIRNERENIMQNTVTITGTVKNIKTYQNERGTLLTGWLDQRDTSRFSDGTADKTTYVVGMNIIALDNDTVAEILGASRAGQEATPNITITGRLVTKFDRRQNIDESKRRAPYAQLEVHAVEVTA